MILPNPKIPIQQKAALGMGFIALFFSAQSIEALAISYFQMSLGIDPFLLALIMTVPIAIGAFISPWVGRLSDGFTSRWGRRKPFVLVGGWGAGLFFSLIWMVPVHWSHTWILWYFFVFSVLFILAELAAVADALQHLWRQLLWRDDRE